MSILLLCLYTYIYGLCLTSPNLLSVMIHIKESSEIVEYQANIKHMIEVIPCEIAIYNGYPAEYPGVRILPCLPIYNSRTI